LPIAESQPARVSKCVSIPVSDCISVTQSKPAHISKSFAVSCSITVAFSDSNSVAEPKPVAHLGRGA
jgi:hypothetical protein